MDQIDQDGFRANVGIILMRDDGRLFLGRRIGNRGWQFPQGGVRRGEPVEQALFRELKEEIGLDPRPGRRRRLDAPLAALPPAGALRAPRPDPALHRPEAALVPAAAAQRRRPAFPLRPHRRARIRPVALGRLLGAGARGDPVQAAGLPEGPARARRAAPFPDGLPALSAVVARRRARLRAAAR